VLQLKNIQKDYRTGDTVVRALKGVSLNFRKSEFVSILGPSGCGKTTMLNIIGGLDDYTAGDLSVNGRSTADFKDRDWDVYRNHRIGFIFQSYNLIPHQTVLANVELALTIAGVSKQERVERAKKALDEVGLSDKYYKKPNQLSGGQCQRVAIARALVNNPEILLADEPTGALDSETSVQIMNLVQKISKERLVIMVTHNPELAQEYSTRIIQLKDGLLTDDSSPYIIETETDPQTTYGKVDQHMSAPVAVEENADNAENAEFYGHQQTEATVEKAKMSLGQAFRLSLQNLFSKKRRTIMVSIASAIGIIGVSLVLAISFGMQNFIRHMQNEMLAANPIEINQTGFDMDAINNLMSASDTIDWLRNPGYANVEALIEELYSMIEDVGDIFVNNEITPEYIQFLRDMPREYWSALRFNYGLNTTYSFFTDFNGSYTSLSGILQVYAGILENIAGFEEFANLLSMVGNPVRQAASFEDQAAADYLIHPSNGQFDVVWNAPGSDGIARTKNEVMLVLDRDQVITDIMLGQLGFISQDQFMNIVYDVVDHPRYNPELNFGNTLPLEDLAAQNFFWHPNNEIFSRHVEVDLSNPASLLQAEFIDVFGLSGDAPHNTIPFTYSPVRNDAWTQGVELNIVGILTPKEDVSSVMMPAGLWYTTALAEHMIAHNWNSEIMQDMREYGIDSFMGAASIMDDSAGEMGLPAHLTPIGVAPGDIIGNARVVPFSIDYFYARGDATEPYTGSRIGFVGTGGGDSLMSLLFGMGMGGGGDSDGAAIAQIGMRAFGGGVYSRRVYHQVHALDQSNSPILDDDGGYTFTDGDFDYWHVYTDADGNAFPLPNNIMIFSSNFNQVDHVNAYLDSWNNPNAIITVANWMGGEDLTLTHADREAVQQTDMLSLMMNLIALLIQIITIALVSFTALSLVVSSVMIGILTYVSVMERIKEIGVIRSMGGRKRDISNLFTAETVILGLIAGLVGIIITYLLSGVLNLITIFVGVGTIAALPWWVAIIMVGLSVLLTFTAGILPSLSAANKNPVTALRTE